MVQQLIDELRSLWESITIEQEVAGDHAITESEAILTDVEQDIARLTLEGAYRRHLLEYIQSERDAFQDGRRAGALCSCENPYCPVKTGRLPSRVRMADSLEAGITRFLTDHDGDATVLVEARRDWVREVSDAKSSLRQALRILRRDERPEDTDGDDTEDDEAEAESGVVSA